MKWFLVFVAFVLGYQPCNSRSLNEEDSVVSVYTTLPTTANTAGHLDVYRQIADNIAERITQPIYRFFGIRNSTVEEKTTTKRPFEHIELDSTELTNPTRTGKNDSKPDAKTDKTDVTTNEITPDRDVEELSVESLKKSDKKPEKFTLYSYLPVKENIDLNDTKVERDENSLELDDVDSDDIDLDDDYDDKESPRGFIYLLELAGSIIQLLWGGFLALFKPATSTR